MPNHDVADAQQWNDDLIRWEATGWGDAGNAMRRIARSTGIPFSKLWALKYRPPKEVASHILRRLEAAHAAAKARQLGKLSDETALTARIAGPDHRAVRASEALLRAAGCGAPGSGAELAPAVLGEAPPRERVQADDLNDLPLWRAMTEE